MTLWKRGIALLWQRATAALQQASQWLSDERGNPVDEPYLLHPRCCRNDQCKELR